MAAEKLRETCDADGHLGDTSVFRQFWKKVKLTQKNKWHHQKADKISNKKEEFWMKF